MYVQQTEICDLCKKETDNHKTRNVCGKEAVVCEDCSKEYFEDK